MFSIPSPINLSYSNVGLRPVVGSLAVGEAIKDMQDGTATPAKRDYEKKVSEIQNKFEQDTKAYHERMEVLTGQAEKAEGKIGSARVKKALAITLLALSVVSTVGLTIAAIATGTFPLLFLAAPFAVGIVPTSYFTHEQRKGVSQLEKAIDAPQKLRMPHLQLPVYHSRQDFDLLQSRSDAQNAISRMTLAQIATSDYSVDAIVKYALLDRVATLPVHQRPVFYAKCIQLIENYGAIVREHVDYKTLINRETSRLRHDLSGWANDQESRFNAEQMRLNHMERELNSKARRGEFVPSVDRLSLHLAHSSLENQRIDFARASERRTNEINRWKEQMDGQNDSVFTQSKEMIEQQFAAMKAAAL